MARADFYRLKFPNWPAPRADERWLDGMWVLGNNYRGSGLYGAYPPNYLNRIMSMFPDAENVLHLFSGSLPASSKYTRLDTHDADIICNAEQLSQYVKVDQFDLILADPPYSVEDALHYGQPMINRNKVLTECSLVLPSGGYLVLLL